jgi:hypothetical protein
MISAARAVAILSAGALALLLVPAALAGTASFSGRFKGGGTIEFKAKFKRGKPVQVVHDADPAPFGRGLSYTSVPVRCDQGDEEIISQVPKALKVDRRGRFHYRIKLPQGQPDGSVEYNRVKITGKFVSKRKAKGTLRFQGALFHDDGVRWTNCDSGVVNWTATR